MSKSKFNGVSPDEILEEFGADALRLFEMFMGPFDKEKVWNTDAVSGCRRFLNRFYDFAYSEKLTDELSQDALKLGHRLVYAVTKDVENMHFNTAIARMMEFVNDFSKLEAYPKEVLKMATQMLYPFAPHISEEIWQQLGGSSSMAYVPLPVYDPLYLKEYTLSYVIQINGKVRGSWDLKAGLSKDELLAFAKKQEKIQKYLHQGEMVKVIFVPDKLLNIVVKPL